MVKPKFLLDYGLIKEQIDRLLESVPNKLEREWAAPTKPAFAVILGTVTTVGNTFKTIGFLCVEKPRDWRHRPEMALAVPPLARTILDALYTCVFLFEGQSQLAPIGTCAPAGENCASISTAQSAITAQTRIGRSTWQRPSPTWRK